MLVYNFVALSTSTLLCSNHHHPSIHLSPELFHLSKLNLCPHWMITLLSFLPPTWASISSSYLVNTAQEEATLPSSVLLLYRIILVLSSWWVNHKKEEFDGKDLCIPWKHLTLWWTYGGSLINVNNWALALSLRECVSPSHSGLDLWESQSVTKTAPLEQARWMWCDLTHTQRLPVDLLILRDLRARLWHSLHSGQGLQSRDACSGGCLASVWGGEKRGRWCWPSNSFNWADWCRVKWACDATAGRWWAGVGSRLQVEAWHSHLSCMCPRARLPFLSWIFLPFFWYVLCP